MLTGAFPFLWSLEWMALSFLERPEEASGLYGTKGKAAFKSLVVNLVVVCTTSSYYYCFL